MSLGIQGDTLIRELFIANMQDSENQRELLRETLDPSQALRLAIKMELGQRNQLQISNTQPAAHVNAITRQRFFRQSNHRPNTLNSTRQPNQLCRNCGLTWSANHRDDCIAKGKTCNIFGLQKPEEYAVSQSHHPLSPLVQMLTQLRRIQLNSRSMQSKIQITTPNENPTMIVQMIIW